MNFKKIERLKQQPKWLKNYLIGLANPENYSVFLTGKKYAIIKLDGGSVWTGWGTSYCSPHYDLVPIKIGNKGYWHCPRKEVHVGRMNKKLKEKFTVLLEKYDKGELFL